MLLTAGGKAFACNHSLQGDEKTPAITDCHRKVSPQHYTDKEKHTFPSLEQQDHTLSSCFFNSSACFCTVSFSDSRTSFTSTSAAASFLSSSMFSLLRDSVFSVNCARRKVFSRCSSCRHRQPLNLGSYKLALGSPRAVPSSHLTHSEIAPASAATSTALIQPKDLRAGNLRGHRGDGNSTQGTI